MKYKLEELIELKTQGVNTTTDNIEYVLQGHKIVQAKNIQPYNITFDDKNFVSEETYKRMKYNHKLHKGDILYTNIGSQLGNSAIYNSDEEAIITWNVMKLIPKQQIITNDFLCYLLNYYKADIVSLNSSSTMPFVSGKELMNFEFEVPSLLIQNKVTKILKTIEHKIKLNAQTNDNLLNLAKLRFEEWLTSCDEELFIKDMADEILDYNKNNNEKVKLLNSSDVTLGNFPKVDFVDNKDLKGHFKKRFQKYDVLYSQIRPRNMHFGYALMDDYNDYIASTRLMVVRNKKDIVSSSVLYFYLTSREAIEDFTLKTESRSGTFPQGNYEDLSSFKVKYSSDQDEITKLLDLTLEKIYFNNKQNETLEQLRDTLLPKLMNGEIDLDKIEI